MFSKFVKYKFAVINAFISFLNSVKCRFIFVVKMGKVTSIHLFKKIFRYLLSAYAVFPELVPQWKKYLIHVC